MQLDAAAKRSFAERFDAIRRLSPDSLIPDEDRWKASIKDLDVGDFLVFDSKTWVIRQIGKYYEFSDDFKKKKKYHWTELRMFAIETGEVKHIEWEIDDELEIVITSEKLDFSQLKDDEGGEGVAEERRESLVKWMQEVLASKVKEVHVSKRLEGSPAIIVNPDGFMTSSMERIMMASKSESGLEAFGNKNLEINPRHQLLVGLDTIRDSDEAFAKSIVEQIHDNAMIQAGLIVEPREMVERSYRILERAVGK